MSQSASGALAGIARVDWGQAAHGNEAQSQRREPPSGGPAQLVRQINGTGIARLALRDLSDEALDRMIEGVAAMSGRQRDRALTYLMIHRDARK
jgi:hypothetical protein